MKTQTAHFFARLTGQRPFEGVADRFQRVVFPPELLLGFLSTRDILDGPVEIHDLPLRAADGPGAFPDEDGYPVPPLPGGLESPDRALLFDQLNELVARIGRGETF